MCTSTIVAVICSNPGCIYIIDRYSIGRHHHPDIGRFEACDQVLQIKDDEGHEIQCLDITRRSCIKCEGCFEEAIIIALADAQEDGMSYSRICSSEMMLTANRLGIPRGFGRLACDILRYRHVRGAQDAEAAPKKASQQDLSDLHRK